MANRPSSQTYDKVDAAEDMLPQQHVQVTINPSNLGIIGTLLGTVAAAADLCQLFVVPANSNIKVTGAKMRIATGGTAVGTGPHWGLASSLASLVGTGARTVFGTMTFGTYADGAWGDFTAAASVAAGSIIHLTSIVGTDSGGSQVADWVVLQYKEDWT